MNRMRRPGSWGCLVALILGLGLSAPVAGEESATPTREWLRNESTSPEETPLSPWRTADEEHSRNWGLLGSGVGLVAGVGLALWVKSEADERYAIYLSTADPDAARKALEDAERYDRATLIGWGLAQVSFVAIVYFLTREGKRPLIPAEGEPLVRPYKDGVQIGIRVTP